MGRTLLSDAFDLDFAFDLAFDSDREGRGFKPRRKAPQEINRRQPLRDAAPNDRTNATHPPKTASDGAASS